METSINQRIAEIINQEEKGNRTQFADRVGRKLNQISNWTNEGASIGLEVVKSILLAYPRVNANWLILGKGEMCSTQIYEPVEPKNPVSQFVDHDENITCSRDAWNIIVDLKDIIYSQQRTAESQQKTIEKLLDQKERSI